jgi:hypothetical protein
MKIASAAISSYQHRQVSYDTYSIVWLLPPPLRTRKNNTSNKKKHGKGEK